MPKILNGQNMGTKLLILIDLVKMIFLLMHILELFFFFKAYNHSQSSEDPDLYFGDFQKNFIKCRYLYQHDWLVTPQSGWQNIGSSNKSKACKWNRLSEVLQCQSIIGVVIEHENWREAKAFNFKVGEHILITGFNLIVTVTIMWKKYLYHQGNKYINESCLADQ